MTGCEVFWSAFRREMAAPVQTKSFKREQNAAGGAPQQSTAKRSLLATSQRDKNAEEGSMKAVDDQGWANDMDEVSLWAFLYLK
jgi:hypothetical protein